MKHFKDSIMASCDFDFFKLISEYSGFVHIQPKANS